MAGKAAMGSGEIAGKRTSFNRSSGEQAGTGASFK